MKIQVGISSTKMMFDKKLVRVLTGKYIIIIFIDVIENKQTKYVAC